MSPFKMVLEPKYEHANTSALVFIYMYLTKSIIGILISQLKSQ